MRNGPQSWQLASRTPDGLLAGQPSIQMAYTGKQAMMIQPVILAGGSGSRLWPLSREIYPKQLLHLTGSRSLLQATLERVARLENIFMPIIVVGEEHRFATKEHIDELKLFPNSTILLEPLGRSTAPAICGTVEYIRHLRGEDTIVLVLPSDHLIGREQVFTEVVTEAAELAQKGRIVTFGIPIERAETGYGYIREGADGFVERFREKPDIESIKNYIDEGGWYWNSGMFTFTVDIFQREMLRYAQQMQQCMTKAIANGSQDGDFYRFDAVSMADVEDTSIDYVLMEKTDCASVVPADLNWRDVGSWQAVWEIMAQDDHGNVCWGDIMLESTTDSLVVAEDKLVAAVGLENTVVVETADAVLVSSMGAVQDIKKVVGRLKALNRDEFRLHATVHRPWGSRTIIKEEGHYRINKLRISPGSGMALQKHYHRSEHWLVASGTARVTNGREVVLLHENQSSSIPAGVKHRLENPGAIPLELIEIQMGTYLGEDDVVRYDEEYGASKE